MHGFCLSYQNYFYFKAWVFSYFLFWFLAHPTAGEQAVWCLVAAGLSRKSVTPLWDDCLSWQHWPGTLSSTTQQKLLDTAALLWLFRQQQQFTAVANWLFAPITDEHCVYWKSCKVSTYWIPMKSLQSSLVKKPCSHICHMSFQTPWGGHHTGWYCLVCALQEDQNSQSLFKKDC